MKKIAIIYSPRHPKLDNAAKILGATIETTGHRVDYLHIGSVERSPSVRQYDFVYLGSIAEGGFGGKIPEEVIEYIKQCRGLQGSKSATFLIKRLFGNNKGMKRLMGLLESMGSQVIDFQIISDKADAETLGKRLIL